MLLSRLFNTPVNSIARVIFLMVLVVQIFTHLAWLQVSTHPGQLTIPWMMNHGMVMYSNVLEHQAPGSTILVALAQRLLPIQPILITRFLNLLLVLVTSVCVYEVALRLGNGLAAITAVLVWTWWEPVYANILFYFDNILGFLFILCVLVWVLLEGRGPAWFRPLLLGLLMGGAAEIKQNALLGVVLFAVWMILFLPKNGTLLRALVLYGLGVLILPLMTLAIPAAQGNLASYLYWHWEFNFVECSKLCSSPLTIDFFRKIALTNVLAPAFWLLALRDKQRRSIWVLLGLMWVAGSATMYPRPEELHATGQLPALAVMSGLVIGQLFAGARLQSLSKWFWQARLNDMILAGVGIAILAGWGLSGLPPYVPGLSGHHETLAYDEFQPLVARLKAISQPTDTLYILPELDSTPQIHEMSGLLPPGTWVKNWTWYMTPAVIQRLLTEWTSAPPTYVIVFPDIAESTSGHRITSLVAFVQAHYDPVYQIEKVELHGRAVIYHVRSTT